MVVPRALYNSFSPPLQPQHAHIGYTYIYEHISHLALIPGSISLLSLFHCSISPLERRHMACAHYTFCSDVLLSIYMCVCVYRKMRPDAGLTSRAISETEGLTGRYGGGCWCFALVILFYRRSTYMYSRRIS